MPAPSDLPKDTYSPQLRTGLILTGAGTAGAYHAGVLRALQEAGVKVDVLAGAGIGVASALFAAIDGGARLWAPDGIWSPESASHFYRVRPALRVTAWALVAALAVVLLPVVVLALGMVVYPIGFLLRVAGLDAGSDLARTFTAVINTAFDPAFLPSVLPRALLLSLSAFVAVAALVGVLAMVGGQRGRRDAAPVWWRLLGTPLSAHRTIETVSQALWRLLGGAAGAKRPSPVDLSRAYAELLKDNLGQPGFRELILTVHDLDVRRDFVFAMISDRYRRDFFRATDGPGKDRRLSESFDLAGVARDHLVDALAASLSLPVGTDVRMLSFPPESYWCGEVHRVSERPGAVDRLLDELRAAAVEQVIVVGAFPEVDGPHRLGVPRGDWRGRVSDYLAGAEAAALRSALAVDRPFRSVFLVRPSYNPVGPLDVAGCYDERSDRHVPLSEVISRGYEDAYRQFIDPVVGASGEHLDVAAARPV